MKKLFVLLLTVIFIFSLTACGGNDADHEIVGRWVSADDSSWVTTFNADGSGTHTISWGYGTSFRWSIRSNSIRWDYSGHPNMETPFRISGDSLFITVDGGFEFLYIRD